MFVLLLNTEEALRARDGDSIRAEGVRDGRPRSAERGSLLQEARATPEDRENARTLCDSHAHTVDGDSEAAALDLTGCVAGDARDDGRAGWEETSGWRRGRDRITSVADGRLEGDILAIR